MNKIYRLLLFLFGFSIAISHGHAQAESTNTRPSPVVVELFTSQSCSSCPPADRLLGEYEKRANVIALSCHVTYWNHLHWKDTLSKEFCTQRQRSYAAARTGGRVYTPEALINGQISIVGSDRRKLERIIAAPSQRLLRINIRKESGTRYIVQLPQSLTADISNIKLDLITFGKPHTQSVPRGENRGRKISYTNPVTDISAISKSRINNQGQITIELTKDNLDFAGFAILAHKDHKHGRLIAAGQHKM